MIDIAAQIPPWAKRVAELGALREKAGEAFLRIQPQAEYRGITDDLEELREAGEFLTHVDYVLPEEVDFAKLGISELDVLIVRGNYLRCLTAKRLKAWASLLSEEGQLLLEVPNPGYIRPYLEVLAGRRGSLPYAGLSTAAVRRLLQEADLQVLSAQGSYDLKNDASIRQSKENAALVQGLNGLLQGLGWQAGGDRDPWMQGFLFKAVRKLPAQEEKIYLQAVVGETVVTPRVRVYEPHDFLATEPAVHTVTFIKDQTRGRVLPQEERGRKLLIRHRLTYADVKNGLEGIEKLRQDGCLTVLEMDDNPRFFMKQKQEKVEAQELSYTGTHAIQVSTEPLAEVFRRYNPHVKVFKNHLKELPKERSYVVERLQRLKEGEDYVNFFFGALNRKQEWQDVMPLINEAAAKYGSRLRFKVLSDVKFFEALQTRHKEFIGSPKLFGGQFVPYEVYTRALHEADISFLPLHDNDFNRTKSDLKFIESAGHGAAVLASPTVYEGSVRQGRTGFIYRNPQEFKAYLELLIENRERRLETAEAAYRYVKNERLLANHYLERLAWYRELLERMPELDRELGKRLESWREKHSEGKAGAR